MKSTSPMIKRGNIRNRPIANIMIYPSFTFVVNEYDDIVTSTAPTRISK